MLLGDARPGRTQDSEKNAREQFTVVLSVPGEPGSLELSLVNGSIRVAGTAGKDVVIDAVARPRHGDRYPSSKAETNGMKRLSAASIFDLTAEGKNNHVEITTDSYQGPVDLTIWVPQKFSLKLSTVNNGDITVDNVTGELETANVNGAIKLSQVAGSKAANTLNSN